MGHTTEKNPKMFQKSAAEMRPSSEEGGSEKMRLRNREIYLKKIGLIDAPEEPHIVKKMTYRKLSEEYGLSVTRLQYIIKREKERYGE